jgi:hypothetical protein
MYFQSSSLDVDGENLLNDTEKILNKSTGAGHLEPSLLKCAAPLIAG